MRIERVETFALRLPLSRPFIAGGERIDVRDLGVLRLTDEDGVQGLGEITPYPSSESAPLTDLLGAFEVGAADALVGAEIFDEGISFNGPLPPPVEAAIDVALLDMVARREGARVADLIGDEIQDQVAVNATITSSDPIEVAELAAAAVEAGATTIKLKVGHSGADQARLEALRSTVGFEPLVRLDANGAWHTNEAIELIGELQEYGLELIEQPVPADDLAAMHRVRDAVATPIVADEGVRSLNDLDRHIANGACDGVAIKISEVGGITAAARLADRATRAGLLVFATSTLDGPVGLAAALHFAAARSDFSLANGLATGELFEEQYAHGLPRVIDGALALGDAPGLGIDLDDAALAEFSIP